MILRNCRLVPALTEGFTETMADIVIEGKEIKEIYPVGVLRAENQEELDVAGATVLPGFFDLHAHLMFANQDYNASVMRTQNEYLLDCMEYAKVY